MSTGTASQMYTYFRVFDGVRVRFADTKADSDTTVLMLAPWPESLWAFRRIWDRITSLGRVVAIDMPGFGHSDQPPELIAPESSGAFLAGLIDQWGLGAPHSQALMICADELLSVDPDGRPLARSDRSTRSFSPTGHGAARTSLSSWYAASSPAPSSWAAASRTR